MNQVEQQAEELRQILGAIEMDVLTNYTLADAIREGAQVSGQAYNWTDGQGNMCALSAAVVAARARDYM